MGVLKGQGVFSITHKNTLQLDELIRYQLTSEMKWLKTIPVFIRKQKQKLVKEICFQFVAIKCSKN